jgi:O-antigen ligase
VGIVIALFFGLNFRDYTMRGESDLTGRTELWGFVLQQIYARPFLGYGYGSGGSILLSRFSPLWDAMWNEGPHTSLHNGYIEHMVDVGIPATAFWLFVTLRPWVHLFRHEGDPNHLKSVFFLIVLPLLIQNCSEAAIGDCEGSVGVLFGVCWFMAERYRLASLARTRTAHERELANAPAGIRALLFNQC